MKQEGELARRVFAFVLGWALPVRERMRARVRVCLSVGLRLSPSTAALHSSVSPMFRALPQHPAGDGGARAVATQAAHTAGG